MTPAESLVRRLRELALMLELRNAATVSRDAMLTHVRNLLAKYEAEANDAARADQHEWEQRENDAEWFV